MIPGLKLGLGVVGAAAAALLGIAMLSKFEAPGQVRIQRGFRGVAMETNYNKADLLCEYADWLTFKLTGKWTRNLSNMAARWYYDAANGGFPADFYEMIGLGDALDKFPQETHYLGKAVHHLASLLYQENSDGDGNRRRSPRGAVHELAQHLACAGHRSD